MDNIGCGQPVLGRTWRYQYIHTFRGGIQCSDGLYTILGYRDGTWDSAVTKEDMDRDYKEMFQTVQPCITLNARRKRRREIEVRNQTLNKGMDSGLAEGNWILCVVEKHNQ